MSTGTMVLNLRCENPKCKHALLLEVCTTIAKGQPAVSLEPAMQAAAVVLGYARVHAPGTTPRVLCGACRGRTVCRACGIERVGDDLCAYPSFDVDRVIEEGAGDADRG